MRRRLAYFMTVVMTFGMLMGVPAKGSVVEATEGGFMITGGTAGTDYSYSNGKLSILKSTPMTITTAGEEISDSIYIGSSSGHDVNLTLESLVIVTDGTPGIEIEDNYKGNVNLTLVGTTTRGTNYNVDSATNFIQGIDAPAIQKNGTSGGTLTIKGTGDLWVESLGDGVAAIGGSKGNSSGNIQISNGIVSAVAYSTGAAIGGGAGGDGTNIKISGGDVYTNILIPTTENYPDTKSYGASIGGGGSGGDGTNIIISGGKVNANATASGNHTGAGIGGGHLGVANGIVISGGTVVAKGGYNSAGIGAGSEDYYLGDSYIEKKNTDVSVSGGKITATGGGLLGAGIGSGSKWPTTDRTVTTVTITGGTVVANGGQDAPGVGAGQMASSVTYISGGSVLAKGGSTAISTNKYTGQDVGFGEHQMDKTDTYSRVLQRTSSDNTQVSLYTHPLSNTANFNSGKIALEITYNGSVYNYGMNDVTSTDGKVYLYLPANAKVAEKTTNEYTVTTEATSGGKVTAAAVAYGGSNYTFDVSANDGYVISSVKYKVGNGSYTTLEANSGGTDTDASYTIEGSRVTDNITLKAEFTQQVVVIPEYSVTTESTTNGSITAASTVKSGETLTFTVEADTYYTISSVAYKVGNGSYTIMDRASGSDTSASYTISGSVVTDNISIKATFERETVNVTKEAVTNGTITAATTAEKGNSFTFTVTPSTGYDISKVYYKVGNGNYKEITESNGSYTIEGSRVTDNITLKAEFTQQVVVIPEYSVTTESTTNGSITAASTVKSGEALTFTVNADTYYTISSVAYKVGNGSYIHFTTNESDTSASYKIPSSAVTGDISIKATFTRATVTVTKEYVTNGTIAAATTAEKGNSFNFTVTPSTGYDISKVYYKVGNGDYQELTGSNGSYTIAGSSVTDNISIKAEFVLKTLSVTKASVSNATVNGASTTSWGTDYTFDVSAHTGYMISNVSYQVNGGTKQNMTKVSGNEYSARYTIPGSAVTGAISINVETKKVLDLSSLEWNYSGGYYYKNADYTVELTIPSDIQAGIQSLEYRDNRKSDIGSYTATATITCKDGYSIVGSVEPCNWQILEYTPWDLSIKYNYSTTKKEWYNTAVTVSADNYLIAEGSADGYFGLNVTYTATATKTLYFKHATTGYITSGRVVGVQIDTVKPTGSIRIDNASFDQDKWDGSTNASRYHLSSTAVSIHADDYVNGYQIAYHVTDQTYYKSDLENANLNWVNGTSCSIQDNTKQRVYARIIDQAGNITYLSTPLIYNDTVVPTIGVQQTSVTSSGARYEMTFKDDAGSVKYAYVLLKDTEEAPSDYNAILAKINEGAIGGTGTGVDATASFSSLSPNTKYALYIAASDGLSTLNGLSNANVSAVGKYSFTTSRATAVLHDCTEPIKPVTSATNETFDLKAKLFDEVDISTFRNIKYSISVGSGNVLSKTPSEPDGNTLTLPVRANPSGEQEVYITVKSDNYEDIKVTLTLVVTSKVQLELSGVSCPTYTYNDIPQNYPGYTGNIVWKNGDAIESGVNTTVTFQGGDNYNSTNPPTEAGRYTITFTISNNADYIGSKTMTYVIEKATIDMSSVAWYLDDETVPSVDGREVVNDGEQHQMIFGGYPENLIRVSYKQDERYVTSGSETRQYATRVDYEVIDSKNYNTPNPAYNTISWEIVNPEIQKENPDMSKVKWVYQQGETEQEYKQGETKLVANGNEYTVMLTGLPDYVTPEYSGVTSATDAGEYKVSVSFQVSDDSRYIVPDDMTLTWSVSEKEIEKETEKLTPDMSKVKWIYTYNGVTSDYITGTTKLIEDGSEYNLSLTGVPEGVTVDYSGTVTSSKAGNYTVKAKFTNADATKYTDPSPTSMELNWSIDAATQEDNDSSNETPVVGAEEVVGTNKYKVVSSSTTGGTVEYTGPMDKKVAAVTVPATIEVNGQSYQVTTIGTGAFSGCKQLSSVTIQSGITTIGKNAFKGCVKLKTVNVPGSVTSIGSNAFNGCTALTKVTIGKKVTTIGAGAFSGCKKLKTVTISNSAALKTVGDKAFYKCVALTKIVLPKNVTTIGKSAFEGCKKLKTITIKSKKLKKVGSKAIKGIYNKATIKCPGKTYVKKYKKLFKSTTGYKKTMKIK